MQKPYVRFGLCKFSVLMGVTQKEIAAKPNISQSQVARALSGNTVASAKTRQRIEATAREMGYDPDAHSEARFMNARRHNKPIKKGTIAILFHFLGASPRNLPFYSPFLDGVESEVVKLKSNVCLCMISVVELPRLIKDRNVDGVIVMGEFPELAAQIQGLRLPVVSFHTDLEGISGIGADDFDGARKATRYLHELGHRRIGYIGVNAPGLNPAMQRLAGYRQAMQVCGLVVRDEWIVERHKVPQPTAQTYCYRRGHCDECAACLSWKYLREKHSAAGTIANFPTAFVCHNDTIAMGIADNAAKDGVQVPRDLSLVGFDNMSIRYRFDPTITSIDLPLREMGEGAVQLLQEVGLRQETSQPVKRTLPVSLVVHESTRALH